MQMPREKKNVGKKKTLTTRVICEENTSEVQGRLQKNFSTSTQN